MSAAEFELSAGTPARIVVGATRSPSGVAALQWAVAEADRLDAVVELVLAWDFSPYLDASVDLAEVRAHGILARLVAEAGLRGHPRLQLRAVRGEPRQVLVDAAQHAAVVVVGGGKQVGRLPGLPFGSVTLHLLTHSPAPVLVVPLPRPQDRAAPEHGDPGGCGGPAASPVTTSLHSGLRVVAGVDGSSASVAALKYAEREAFHRGGHLVALAAYGGEFHDAQCVLSDAAKRQRARAMQQLREAVAQAFGPAGPRCATHLEVRRDTAARGLVSGCATAQLLVLGEHEKHAGEGFRRVADYCREHAACPVVVVEPAAQPPPGAGSGTGQARFASRVG